MKSFSPRSTSQRLTSLGALLSICSCAAPANELPSFARPEAVKAAEIAPIPLHAAFPAAQPSHSAPVDGATDEPEIQIVLLQLSVARAQRKRGELRERLDAMTPAEREGPTGRNLEALLAAQEEEIRAMGRELVGLTSQP